MECQVIPQILHLHLDQLLPLKSRGSEALAEVAEQGPTLGLVGAGRAKVLLTVQADVLGKRGEGIRPSPCSTRRPQPKEAAAALKAQSKPSNPGKSAKCLPVFLKEERD